MSAGLAVDAGRDARRLEGLESLGSLEELLRDSRRQAVVLGSSKDPNAKVTVLLLSDAGTPALAVKVPTTGVAAEAVEAEATILAGLRRGPGRADSILDTVPEPLGTVAAGGLRALAVSVLPGAPMATSYHRWRHTARPRAVTADFAAAATWLARFQGATAGGEAALDDAAVLAERLTQRFGHGLRVGRVAEAFAAIQECLADAAIRRCAVHGDYWFGNLLVQGPGGPVRGVVDWEAGALDGSPLRDLARFPLSYALYLDRHTRMGRAVPGHPGLRAGVWGAGLRYAIQADAWFPRLFRRFMTDGLDRLGLAGIDARDLAMLGIAEVAVTADHEDFARDHLELLCQLAEDRP